MGVRALLCATLLLRCGADDDDDGEPPVARMERAERRPSSGDYAAARCTAHNPRTEKINRLCEAFAVNWDIILHDLDDVCDGPCPDDVTPDLEYFERYKIASLGFDAELYTLEAELAGLYGDDDAAARLAKLARVSKATATYESTGDGSKLADLLDRTGVVGMRDFMKAPKAMRTTALFEVAERDSITIMEALRREAASRKTKKKRKKRRRKADAAPL